MLELPAELVPFSTMLDPSRQCSGVGSGVDADLCEPRASREAMSALASQPFPCFRVHVGCLRNPARQSREAPFVNRATDAAGA
jgi:hypothetical protein